MADYDAPSQDNWEPSYDASPEFSGNEPGYPGGPSSDSAPDQDLTALPKERLVEEVARLQERMAATNRDYGASKHHAMTLRQELEARSAQMADMNARLQLAEQHRLQLLQQQAIAQQQQAAVQQQARPDPNEIPDDVAKQMMEASIEGDVEKFKTGLSAVGQQITQKVKMQQAVDQIHNMRTQAAQTAIQRMAGPEFANNPALTQRVNEHYRRLMADPVTQTLEATSAKIRVGMEDMNVGVLKDAIWQTKLEMLSGRVQAADVMSRSGGYAEPSYRQAVQTPPDASARPRFNVDNPEHVRSLLSEDELDYCRRTRKDPRDYFKWMPDAVKRARVETGRALTSAQLGLKIVS